MNRWQGILCFLLVLACQPGIVRAERVVLFLGDSLTAGQGVEAAEAYPQVLAAMLAQDGMVDLRIVNGSISGSTSASGLSRLRWYRGKIRPSVLFLALGANDGLRGLTVEEMAKNLAEVIATAQAEGMAVILAGMELPPNYGDDFTAAFRQVYRELAARFRVELIPFLLEGVGGVAALNQADGIHPNAEGHRLIARHVYPVLKRQLLEAHATGKD